MVHALPLAPINLCTLLRLNLLRTLLFITRLSILLRNIRLTELLNLLIIRVKRVRLPRKNARRSLRGTALGIMCNLCCMSSRLGPLCFISPSRLPIRIQFPILLRRLFLISGNWARWDPWVSLQPLLKGVAKLTILILECGATMLPMYTLPSLRVPPETLVLRPASLWECLSLLIRHTNLLASRIAYVAEWGLTFSRHPSINCVTLFARLRTFAHSNIAQKKHSRGIAVRVVPLGRCTVTVPGTNLLNIIRQQVKKTNAMVRVTLQMEITFFNFREIRKGVASLDIKNAFRNFNVREESATFVRQVVKQRLGRPIVPCVWVSPPWAWVGIFLLVRSRSL